MNTKESELYYKQSAECRRKSWRHGGWDKCTIQGTSDNSCVAMALGNTNVHKCRERKVNTAGKQGLPTEQSRQPTWFESKIAQTG